MDDRLLDKLHSDIQEAGYIFTRQEIEEVYNECPSFKESITVGCIDSACWSIQKDLSDVWRWADKGTFSSADSYRKWCVWLVLLSLQLRLERQDQKLYIDWAPYNWGIVACTSIGDLTITYNDPNYHDSTLCCYYGQQYISGHLTYNENDWSDNWVREQGLPGDNTATAHASEGAEHNTGSLSPIDALQHDLQTVIDRHLSGPCRGYTLGGTVSYARYTRSGATGYEFESGTITLVTE